MKPEDIKEIPFAFVPQAVYDERARMERQRYLERKRQNRQAYRDRRKTAGLPADSRVRHDKADTRKNHHNPRLENKSREFIAWDGEGPQDAGYALFGNSKGMEICRQNLGTEECLNLILEAGEAFPRSIHIIYGGRYDASMILNDLDHRRFLLLQKNSRCIWHDYEIEYVPGKWFKVSKDGVSVKLYDIVSWFAVGYVTALAKMEIGTWTELNMLAGEKARRSEFLWSEIDEIKEYWRLELQLMAPLAEKLRTLFLDSGYDLKAWHGPGALAREALRKHKVKDAMAKCPVDVRVAARYAFAGGRFEMVRGGHIPMKIYNADIHSAYPAYARELPNLARGTWRRTKVFEPGKYAVYNIGYNSGKLDPMKIYPLFRRLRDGTVVWTNKVEGWYWSPEAELVVNDPDATFYDGWVFDEEDTADRPFAWLQEYYDRRTRLKSMGNPLELTFKLIINSVYGQLAQRSGYDKRRKNIPPYHQLEWAGYVTSSCRAAVYKAALSCGDKLISIDTDGIYSMAPIEGLPVSKALGDWEIEEFDEGIFWQSGIYNLREDLGYDPALGYGWVKGKTRGVPKGSYSAEALLDCLNDGMKPLRLMRNVFVGFGAALNTDLGRKNTWIKEPHVFAFGGSGKRTHNSKWCESGMTCNETIHDFSATPIPFLVGRYEEDISLASIQSQPHYIPWLDNDDLMADRKHDIASQVMLYASDDMDADDMWEYDLAIEYIEKPELVGV